MLKGFLDFRQRFMQVLFPTHRRELLKRQRCYEVVDEFWYENDGGVYFEATDLRKHYNGI